MMKSNSLIKVQKYEIRHKQMRLSYKTMEIRRPRKDLPKVG